MASNTIPNYYRPVSLDCVGERTKTRFFGDFTIKTAITHDDRFRIERSFANMLPSTMANDIDPELKLRAQTIAQLDSRIVDAPDWWGATKGGRLLIDSEPLYALLNLCNEATALWDEELDKKASKDDNIQNPFKP